MKNLIFIILSLIVVGCASHNDKSAKTEKDLCDINLNKISNYSAEYSMTTGEPEDSQLKALHAQAQQYKEAGNIKGCISTSEQALSIIGQRSNH